MIKTSHHWKIDYFHMYRHVTMFECCPEPYITLDIDITMRRNSPVFSATVTIPAIGKQMA